MAWSEPHLDPHTHRGVCLIPCLLCLVWYLPACVPAGLHVVLLWLLWCCVWWTACVVAGLHVCLYNTPCVMYTCTAHKRVPPSPSHRQAGGLVCAHTRLGPESHTDRH